MPRSPSIIQNLVPRCLKREQSAEYLALSVTKFNELVDAGDLPKPFRFRKEDRFPVWDRAALDAAVERIQGIAPTAQPTPATDTWADYQ